MRHLISFFRLEDLVEELRAAGASPKHTVIHVVATDSQQPSQVPYHTHTIGVHVRALVGEDVFAFSQILARLQIPHTSWAVPADHKETWSQAMADARALAQRIRSWLQEQGFRRLGQGYVAVDATEIPAGVWVSDPERRLEPAEAAEA